MAIVRRAATIDIGLNQVLWSDTPGWSSSYISTGNARITFPVTFVSANSYACFVTKFDNNDTGPNTGPMKALAYDPATNAISVSLKNSSSLQNGSFCIEIIGEI